MRDKCSWHCVGWCFCWGYWKHCLHRSRRSTASDFLSLNIIPIVWTAASQPPSCSTHSCRGPTALCMSSRTRLSMVLLTILQWADLCCPMSVDLRYHTFSVWMVNNRRKGVQFSCRSSFCTCQHHCTGNRWSSLVNRITREFPDSTLNCWNAQSPVVSLLRHFLVMCCVLCLCLYCSGFLRAKGFPRLCNSSIPYNQSHFGYIEPSINQSILNWT